jgi:nitrite reductase (NADH) small subunit
MAEILVCEAGQIADGGTRLIQVGKVEVGVIFYRGHYHAYRNLCPHQGGPACEGLKLPQIVEQIGEKGAHLGQTFDEDDLHIVCPWHGWEFHLTDGTHVVDPRHRLAKYPVTERHGRVYVTV